MDRGQSFDVIYLDFKKAFDSVPHQRLLLKLESYGITGNVLCWIQDFLLNRSQTVKVGNEYSNSSPVVSGIPQGSVLGPTLFTIFINDLPECVESFCKIFADDTKVYNSSYNHSQIQKDLNEIYAWSDKWQLPFNAGKCKCMHFGQNNPEHTYFLNDTQICDCKEEKDLGITFDPTLKFKIHINNIVSKGNQIVGLIKRNFDYLDNENLSLLYKSLVRPHLEYGQSVWSPFLINEQNSLEKVQRRATKLLPNLKNLPYEQRLKLLNLPSLKYRRLRGDLIEVYNILHTENQTLFKLNNDERTRGHNLKLKKEQCRIDIRKHSFTLRVINEWNNLNDNVVNAKNINEFKNRLDKQLSHLKYTV